MHPVFAACQQMSELGSRFGTLEEVPLSEGPEPVCWGLRGVIALGWAFSGGVRGGISRLGTTGGMLEVELMLRKSESLIWTRRLTGVELHRPAQAQPKQSDQLDGPAYRMVAAMQIPQPIEPLDGQRQCGNQPLQQ